MILTMDRNLSDIFEKYSFPDANAQKEDYFTPAPSQEDYIDDDYDLDDEYDDIAETTHPSEQPTEGSLREGDLLMLVRGLSKHYDQGGSRLDILNNVDLRLQAGEISALIGPSGSGKSTLLHILGLLDTPSAGQIFIGDRDVSGLNDTERTALRNGHIGFVYQFHHLLPEFNALENVALPQVIAGVNVGEAADKAVGLLKQLGLGDRLLHRPATLSGGEQQRVAIARALINDPYLLFADEPTGNLDPETSEEVFEILMEQVRVRGISALIATHNIDLANQMDRVLEIKSGRILPY